MARSKKRRMRGRRKKKKERRRCLSTRGKMPRRKNVGEIAVEACKYQAITKQSDSFCGWGGFDRRERRIPVPLFPFPENVQIMLFVHSTLVPFSPVPHRSLGIKTYDA